MAIDEQRTVVECGHRAPGQRSERVVPCLRNAYGKLWGTPEEAPVQDPVSPSSLYNVLAELGSDDEEDQGRWRSSMGGCSREARVKVRPPPNAVWDPSLLVERHDFICNLGVFFGFPFRYQR